MAKSKMIAKITALLDELDDKEFAIFNEIKAYAALVNEGSNASHRVAQAKQHFPPYAAAVTKIAAEIAALDKHMAAWDSDKHLKNIFKDKKKLKDSRDKANAFLEQQKKNLKIWQANVTQIKGWLAAVG